MKYADLFTPEQQTILAKIKETDLAQREASSTDPLRFKAVSATVAHFLYAQIRRGKAQAIVEFGTSAGYSTIHLAAAAEHTGGKVYTLDREPQKTAWARDNLAACSLDSRVEFFTGEIADFIEWLPDALDFVFFDFGVHSFAAHWPEIRKKTTPGTMLFVDGFTTLREWDDAPEWMAFLETMQADTDFVTSILPLEKSHLLAFRL